MKILKTLVILFICMIPNTSYATTQILIWLPQDGCIPIPTATRVVSEVLHDLDLYDENFLRLVLGTMAVESDMGDNLTHNGFDKGVTQVNKSTIKDNYENFLRYRPKLRDIVDGYAEEKLNPSSAWKEAEVNVHYNIAHCIIWYYRSNKFKIPRIHRDSYWIQGRTWKREYNTYHPAAKGSVIDYVRKYEKYIKPHFD